MSVSTIVFFKLETTGPDPSAHEVIEFAAVAIDTFDGAKVDEIDVLIRPKDQPWQNDWTVNYDTARWAKGAVDELTGIAEVNSFLVRHASVKRTLKKGGKTLRVARLAGHGVSKFDFPFLLKWFRRAGIFFPVDGLCLDTAQLLAMMMPTLAADVGYEELTIETLCGLLDTKRPRDYEGISAPMAHVTAASRCASEFWFRGNE